MRTASLTGLFFAKALSEAVHERFLLSFYQFGLCPSNKCKEIDVVNALFLHIDVVKDVQEKPSLILTIQPGSDAWVKRLDIARRVRRQKLKKKIIQSRKDLNFFV